MTRLFYGSTALAGLCAMTLVIGCGGSSSPKVICDGGNCGDAKRDTSGAKLDGPANPDGVVKLDGQAPTDGPAANLDGPAPKLDGPAPKLDGPAANLDGPAPNLDGPAANLDGPAANLDGPAANLDGPAANLDGPPANLDGPPAKLDGPAPQLDGASLDGTVTPPADASDGGVADTGPDAPVTIVDAAADAAPDLAVVITDAADAAVDAPPVIGDVGPGCEGDACQYTFEGDQLDAGLPPGFTTHATAGGSGTWNLVATDGGTVLQGTAGAITDFAEPNPPPETSTDETIEVKVRFVSITDPTNGVVRICGRFAGTSTNAYCLEITTETGDAGSTGGTMTIDQRTTGTISQPPVPPITTGLDIMVGEWHTYRFSIVTNTSDAGTAGVALKGYLDGVLKVSAEDAPATRAAGGVAIGVREVTADFDNLIVTTP